MPISPQFRRHTTELLMFLLSLALITFAAWVSLH